MIKLTRTGPIGLDFGTDNLKMVQTDFGKQSVRIRSAVTTNYPCPKSELLESPRELKKVISQARSLGNFKGARTVVSMPPEKMQFVSLDYRCKTDESPEEAVITAIQERFADQLSSSVVDYLQIRPEHKEQQDRTALVAMAERHEVINFLELLRKAGLAVEHLEIGPVAINRLISAMRSDERERIVLVVNFGINKSYVTVLWGRRLLLDRELSFGQKTAVESLSTALEVTPVKAEELLNRYGLKTSYRQHLGYTEVGIGETIHEILKHSLRELSTELKRLMLYVASRTRGREVNEAYVFGSIIGWPGLQEFLRELTDLPLQVLEPYYGLDSTGQAEKISTTGNILSLRGIAVATGLSLTGAF